MTTHRPGGEEATCPFCNMPLVSDAEAPEFCGLCGMGIRNVEDAPGILTADGETLLFCCRTCLTVYERSRNHEEGRGRPHICD